MIFSYFAAPAKHAKGPFGSFSISSILMISDIYVFSCIFEWRTASHRAATDTIHFGNGMKV